MYKIFFAGNFVAFSSHSTMPTVEYIWSSSLGSSRLLSLFYYLTDRRRATSLSQASPSPCYPSRFHHTHARGHGYVAARLYVRYYTYTNSDPPYTQTGVLPSLRGCHLRYQPIVHSILLILANRSYAYLNIRHQVVVAISSSVHTSGVL